MFVPRINVHAFSMDLVALHDRTRLDV